MSIFLESLNRNVMIEYGENMVLDIKPSGLRSYLKQTPTVKVFKRGRSKLAFGGLLRKGTPATHPIELNFYRYE